MIKKILYVGNFSFPNGNAAGLRVLNNGYLFEKLGFEVIYIGVDNQLNNNSKLCNTKREYDGKTYYNLPYPNGISGWISYKKRFKEVVELLNSEDKLVAVIAYGSPSLSLFGKKLRDWCRKNNIKYLVDNVDWFSSLSGSLIHKTVKYLDDNYQKRILNSSSDGVIAISSYLSNYYRDKGLKTVIIPPLVNDKFTNQNNFNVDSQNLNLIYVGVPFALNRQYSNPAKFKDRLDIAIDALYLLRENNYIFNIYGLTKDDYLKVVPIQIDILKTLENKIIFHGKVNNSIAKEKVAAADFTMLLRDVNRTTTAGFPTKFVESISCGTPMITTNTSDLADYLEEGVNGFFVNTNSKQLLHKQLNEIFKLSRSKINEMKIVCNESRLFHYENFSEEMREFLIKLNLL